MRLSDINDIPLDELEDYQQVALLRLQLVLTGMTHELISDYGRSVRDAIVRAADDDGIVRDDRRARLVEDAAAAWRKTFVRWVELFQAARREAVAIPVGSLVRRHDYLAELVEQQTEERLEVVTSGQPPFQPQMQAVLGALANRIYGDGFDLSARIWNLQQESLSGIRGTLERGIADGRSAYALAQELEQHLGANQNCTRWTSTRLYSLRPAERINSERGLLRGSPCASSGVAYNALRLARNEIQIAHHEATRALFRQQPWVEGENIQLSPDHPVRDICDEYAEGGPYAIGEVPLPIHVQCMCYAVAVMPDPDEMARRVRGWMRGEETWSEMDAYHQALQRDPYDRRFQPLGGVLAQGMMRWLTAGIDEMEVTLRRVTQDVIWWVISG